MTEPKVERIDQIPIVLHWLMKMQVDQLIDSIWCSHKNWTGLSYGQLSILFITYVIYSLNHRLSYMEEWVLEHKHILEEITGWTIHEKDATDDRLGILLSELGEDKNKIAQFQQENGNKIIKAYDLPTEIVRYDTTSFNVTHDPDVNDKGLLNHGHSKDHRPDLLQFKQGVGSLDPAGIPLLSDTLAGNDADDPLYIPAWREMVKTIGHPEFLYIADSKGAALETRAVISQEGGFYLFPLPNTGKTPEDLKQLVLNPPKKMEILHLHSDQDIESNEKNPIIGIGFSVDKEKKYEENGIKYCWTERYLVSRSDAHAARQKKSLNERLKKAEKALSKLKSKKNESIEAFEHRVNSILKKYRVVGCITVDIEEKKQSKKKYLKLGRPTANTPYEMITESTFHLTFSRNISIIEEKEQLAGWRIYVTNVPEKRLSVATSVRYYRDEWTVERSMHRFKRGCLPVLPLYLKIDERIKGLMMLLTIALQVITLMEFVVRRELAKEDKSLAGLVPGNPRRKISRPTAERLLYKFKNLNCVIYERDGRFFGYFLEQLSPLQVRILRLLGLSPDIYDISFEVSALAKTD